MRTIEAQERRIEKNDYNRPVVRTDNIPYTIEGKSSGGVYEVAMNKQKGFPCNGICGLYENFYEHKTETRDTDLIRVKFRFEKVSVEVVYAENEAWFAIMDSDDGYQSIIGVNQRFRRHDNVHQWGSDDVGCYLQNSIFQWPDIQPMHVELLTQHVPIKIEVKKGCIVLS